MSRCQVKVRQGVLEGHVKKTLDGYAYRCFSGIPYAKPPIGELRFKDPVPIENWQGVLDATKTSKVCAQFDLLFKKAYLGEEDCLYLNVYVPEGAQQNDGLPVMFWIHGGAYFQGSGNPDMYGPEYLIRHNVIVVTINYRVGALGFLCLDIPDAPGNVGLKDQALALKWVNGNIAAFGGDAQNITIFGESAGGASTHHMILSPVTQCLYSKAIMQSGTALCEWAIQTDYEKIAFKLGEKLGIKTTEKTELIKFLQNVPVQQLVMTALSPELGDGITPTFTPVVEKKIPNIIPYIPENPRMQMKNGNFPKISIIAGCTSQEGFYVLHTKTELFETLNVELNLKTLIPDFKALVPKHLRKTLSAEKIEIAANKIKEHYFPTEDNYAENYMKFARDYWFVKDTDSVIRMYSKFMPTYYYQFSFEGSLRLFKQLSSTPYNGASHADELPYLFQVKYDELLKRGDLIPTDQDRLTIERMTKMWTNFAKFGDPTPITSQTIPTTWEKVGENENDIHCLEIGENLTLLKNPFEDAIKFWKSLDDLV